MPASKQMTKRRKPARTAAAIPMRRITMWVPDVTSPEFAREARRQMRALARSPHEKEDQAFVDSISEFMIELNGSPKRRSKRSKRRVGRGA